MFNNTLKYLNDYFGKFPDYHKEVNDDHIILKYFETKARVIKKICEEDAEKFNSKALQVVYTEEGEENSVNEILDSIYMDSGNEKARTLMDGSFDDEVFKKLLMEEEFLIDPYPFNNSDDLYKDVFNEFFERKNLYSCPLVEVDVHLNALYLFYSHFVKELPFIPPSEILSLLDLISVKLIDQTVRGLFDFNDRYSTRSRLFASNNKLKENKKENKQPVIEAFYKISDRENLKSYTIAKKISSMLGKKAPSERTIVNYLKEEGLIK